MAVIGIIILIVAVHKFSHLKKKWFQKRETPVSYWLTRIVFLRFLGLMYFIAFFSLSRQLKPLIGENGLYPAHLFLSRIESASSGPWDAFFKLPTLAWINDTETFLMIICYVGVVLSLFLLCGLANSILMALLWVLYLSLYHVGQLFYGYGWEIMLLEAGFLAIFLVPLLNGRLLPKKSPPPTVVIWMLRWMIFRVMFGAGLIKLRGDPCWTELTCLEYHYETQPIPNPISWYLHQMPVWFHKASVLFSHFVELIVPFLVFGPRLVRHFAGICLILFQVILIISGNLSFLNWLTIMIALACFDDTAFGFLFSQKFRERAKGLAPVPLPRAKFAVVSLLTVLIIYLSIAPTKNLLASRQIMNTSFDQFHIVNTYGAFGHIGKERYEVILQGTDEPFITDTTKWKEYEFKCKPGDVNRRPCVVSPYHYRIDWQIWFAAMQNIRQNPWLIHFIYKLLQNNPGALSLIENNPFPQDPPKYIRAELYLYEFTDLGDKTAAWWKRKWVRSYMPAVSVNDPALMKYLRAYGWVN